MGILRTISEIGLATNGFGQTHDVARRMHNTYIQPLVDAQHVNSSSLTIKCPTPIMVFEDVTVSGTGRGMIRIYSGDIFERDTFAEKDGYWATRLFFSKPGTYILYAKDTVGQEATCKVVVVSDKTVQPQTS
jgi:hypothetical protein